MKSFKEDKSVVTDQVPSLKKAGLVRRLEGETPEFAQCTLKELLRGPRAFGEHLERIFEVEVLKHFDFEDSCASRMSILADLVSPLEFGAPKLQLRWLHEELEESEKRAEELVRAVLNAYWIFEGEDLHSDTTLQALVGYFFADCFGLLEDWFKFQTTYLSALMLKQRDLPIVPKYVTRPGFVMGGRFFRKVRNLLNKATLTDEVVSWAGSILALKRAACPLRIDKVAESLEKHRSTLEKQPDRNQFVGETLNTLEEVVTHAMRKGGSHLKERMPSGSSHFGWSRAEGGAVGRISQLITEKFGETAFLSKEFVGFAHTNWNGQNPLKEIYVPSYSFDLGGVIAQAALRESLDCDVHVVLEPMKARIITSGPPLRYHICRMVQKEVHTRMRRLPEYSLIGGPVTQQVLRENFSSLHNYQRGWFFVSADYSAATDNLNGHLSREFVDLVIDRLGLSGEVAEIYRSSMTGHTLHYPEEFGGSVSEQRTGQLMGSPSSFPGLCAINLAVLYAAWRRYTASKWSVATDYTQMLRDLRPLVNGDDLLFIGPEDFYPLWNQYVRAVGLQPSPGKNYFSRDFAVINSTFFRISWADERGSRRAYSGVRVPTFSYSALFDRVHWIGSGLLKGQARVLSDTRTETKDIVDFGQLRSQLDWVLNWHDGAEVQRERCLAVWFSYMHDTLMGESRSWRLPVALGGLGLPLGGATRPQLVLANVIITTSDVKLSQSLRVRSRFAPAATTAKQLIAEAEFLRSMGAKLTLKKDLPFSVVRNTSSLEDSEFDVVIRDARVHDFTISPYLVGITHASIEADDDRPDIPFCDRMMRVVTRWKGGPTTLENAVAWEGRSCWTGGCINLPHVDFGMDCDAGADLARVTLGQLAQSEFQSTLDRVSLEVA